MTQTVAIVQARTGSTRLPGKVLLPLGGTTVLGCVVERLSAASRLNAIVVATSDLEADDAVEESARRLGVTAVRGSAGDVLARFGAAAEAMNADIVVRITADCPLIDGTLVDRMLERFDPSAFDYLSNVHPRTFPRGLDTEIFTRRTLQSACASASKPYEREHVTPYIYEHPLDYRLDSFIDESGRDRSSFRWTLDTAEDLAFLEALYARFAGRAPRSIRFEEVLDLLDREPALAQINASVPQKTLSG